MNDDIDRDILRQVAGHTERFRLQNQFNIDATLRNAARLLTASCCGKVFRTREDRVRHENVSFIYGHNRKEEN